MPRILLMDDQPDVRAVVTLALRVKGFEVVGFESGAAGLAAFAESPFDLAIVDIFLGGMNGADVMRILRERSPDLPIVAISGVTALDFLAGFPELSNVVCLQKPFRPVELLRAIQTAMEPLALPTIAESRGAVVGEPSWPTGCREQNPSSLRPATTVGVPRAS